MTDRKANCHKWVRWMVCVLLLLSAIADFLTFFFHKQYRIFDISLLTIWTSNILVIFLVKFLVIFGLCYLLLYVKAAGDYTKYLWVLMAVYLIIAQFLGAASNIKVAAQAPPLEQAPSVQQRAETGIRISIVYSYIPIGFALLSFIIWDKGWNHLKI